MRELYLSGLTAAEVSARMGVSVSAIRQRIRREGWSKTALADGRLGGGAGGGVVAARGSRAGGGGRARA